MQGARAVHQNSEHMLRCQVKLNTFVFSTMWAQEERLKVTGCPDRS